MKIILISALLVGQVFAHSGGTDSSGCHHDHKRGGYHCHKSDEYKDLKARKPASDNKEKKKLEVIEDQSKIDSQ